MSLSLDTSAAADGAETLLDRTLKHAVKDRQTVTPGGENVPGPVDGSSYRRVPTHCDDRGSVVEMYDLRWNYHPDPMVFAYCFTIKPGYVKGWNLHKLHEDRYFLLQGEMELVLYDVRPGSSTLGQVSRVTLSETDRRLINVPKYVWHADHNVGTRDVVVVNFPTAPYNHTDPDKYRLPIDTSLIPWSFPGARGW
jgi:dTDP-4-dehydrorhamnose 3,5-epimerase